MTIRRDKLAPIFSNNDKHSLRNVGIFFSSQQAFNPWILLVGTETPNLGTRRV